METPATRQARVQMLLLALAVGIYAVLDWAFDLPPSALEFRSEVVRAYPHGDKIAFDGEYLFFPGHPRRARYELAFPVGGRGELIPESIQVSADGAPLEVRMQSRGFRFALPVRPWTETTVRVLYEQAAPGGEASYVTRTANLWHRPIASARFILDGEARSNYHRAGEETVEFRDFRAEDDWRIYWGEP